MRRVVLAEEPTCRACGRRPSCEVDHITPRWNGGTDDRDNLQGLCSHCHTAKTSREASGVDAKRRRRNGDHAELPEPTEAELRRRAFLRTLWNRRHEAKRRCQSTDCKGRCSVISEWHRAGEPTIAELTARGPLEELLAVLDGEDRLVLTCEKHRPAAALVLWGWAHCPEYVAGVVTDEWKRTKEIWHACGAAWSFGALQLGPSEEQVRSVLVALLAAGRVERRPTLAEQAKHGYASWRLAPASTRCAHTANNGSPN